MTTMGFFQDQVPAQNSRDVFDLHDELTRHAWHPSMDAVVAEQVLVGKPAFTYIVRRNGVERGFAISFVQPNGVVAHNTFTLIDPKFGIFRNGIPHHVGSLEKVIRDMMGCSFLEGQPLV